MPDEPQLSFEQPRSMFRTWLGVVLLFAVFALFVWAVMGAMPRRDSYEEKRAKARLEKLKTAAEEAKTALDGYGWVDKEKGIVRVPVQRAMELAVAELAQKKPAPANPIPPEADKAGLQATAPVGPSAAPTAPPQPAAGSEPKPKAIEGKDSENRGEAAAANNPPGASPGTQPGPSATAAASPPAGASRPEPGVGEPTATPVQSPPGTPLPVRGGKP
ncbi:MAG: hypothetical protein ABR589_09920 [Chthoniobacterales bacterium]